MPPLYPLNLSLAADIEPAAKDTHSPPPQAAGQPERFSRTQMRMVRNLCLYRRRTEPDCFVPDIAFFPPCHQYALPYLLTEDEIARLLATTRLLYTTSAYPLRAQ